MSEQDWKNALSSWLPLATQVRIDRYVKALNDNEFKTLDELASASDQTLQGIGIAPGHIGLLKSKAKAESGLASSTFAVAHLFCSCRCCP